LIACAVFNLILQGNKILEVGITWGHNYFYAP